ncbi:hypothetical protein FPY71_17580 [Aureimonas fodinaquatilis]|uniref:Uncharacterized protein n=1 Tax=Aureimonas fodinaquatilis TaxID=2565783 RepID=A0A5B0DQV9_9HYPH|nr:hypothetical protein [Aureimonas fodinaquatilis]KAA0968141.1 hypothetical protein FPY71_17580 [Aureimonas fodinaquatilis]
MFKRLFAGFGKSSKPAAAVLQDEIVKSVVSNITDLQDGEWEDREWVHIAVNHEVLIEEGRRSSTQAEVLARKPGGDLEEHGFRLSMNTKAKLLELREAMTAEGKEPWTIVDLTIERDGRYAFDFSYTPPPRLGGNLLHSPLTGLLDRYSKRS